MKIGQLLRLWQIAFVWVKYGLDEVALSVPWLKPFLFLKYFNPTYWLRNRHLTQGERLRAALESLGPIFVKFGQILSTRRDLLPGHIADALAKLQDQVKPFPSHLAVAQIEQTLGKPINELFAEFEKTPLASASIAQVHAATLHNGEKVVVKVLRPNIHTIIKRDIALMKVLARFCERAIKLTRRLRAIEIVREVERTLNDELDLTREGANAVQLKRNLENNHTVYIPKIHWDFSSDSVLVIERINGVQISNVNALKAKEVNLKLLGERVIELFYTQAFDHCFFHADMHPGNIFVCTENPADPKIILVDFGIAGSLDKADQHYLAANFLAFFKRDYRRVAELHIESGWVPQKTRVTEFESAMRAVCEPIFEKPLKDISLGHTLLRLFSMAQRFDMIIQPQLLLLQKTMWNIEGVGRELYPDLDVWSISKPFLENWMKKQIGVCGFVKRLKDQWPQISESLPELPDMLYRLLKDKQVEQNLVRQAREEAFEHRNEKPKRRFGFISGLGLAIGVFGGYSWLHNVRWHEFTTSHSLVIGVAGLVILGLGWVLR